MIRKLLRFLGMPMHAGWEKTHRSGFDIRCTGCGERRSKYRLGSSGRAPEWWETTESGDGSCGAMSELPARVY